MNSRHVTTTGASASQGRREEADGGGRREKFVCDVMLGRLARWLRLLGYDTLYDSAAADADLVAVSAREGRRLLTRDRALGRRLPERALLLRHDRLHGQLLQLVGELNLDLRGKRRRCMVCNSTLRRLSPSAAEGRVPEYVHACHGTFRRCPTCERVFWRGSHHRGMSDLLTGLEEGQKPGRR